MLSVWSPTWGWNPQPWDHDLSENQESEAHLSPPRTSPQTSFKEELGQEEEQTPGGKVDGGV